MDLSYGLLLLMYKNKRSKYSIRNPKGKDIMSQSFSFIIKVKNQQSVHLKKKQML